ncbi:hypothetical protein, partial [Nocardia farcinica]|uniref:hypothetical protein n=1 Tax=Nocardia farcinica TaxID=37329 RepID=UPI003CC7F609
MPTGGGSGPSTTTGSPPAPTPRTACSYCGVGCGISVQTTVQGGDGVAGAGKRVLAKVGGDPRHPA